MYEYSGRHYDTIGGMHLAIAMDWLTGDYSIHVKECIETLRTKTNEEISEEAIPGYDLDRSPKDLDGDEGRPEGFSRNILIRAFQTIRSNLGIFFPDPDSSTAWGNDEEFEAHALSLLD